MDALFGAEQIRKMRAEQDEQYRCYLIKRTIEKP